MATTTKSYLCYPVYATGINLNTWTAGAAWTYNGTGGNGQQIVAINTIATPFYLCGISFSFGASADVEYIIEVGYGASGSENWLMQFPISQTRVANSLQQKSHTFLVPEPIFIPANSRIAARGANGSGANIVINSLRIIYQA
jgi:hypothetical protein